MEEEEASSCCVRNKIDRISQLLGEVVTRSEVSENGSSVGSSTLAPAETDTSVAFYERLATFGPGQWGVREVSPLECARYGWRVIQPDVLQCGTCKEVVCAALPLPTDRHAYCQFLKKLKTQVVSGHHEACWWRHSPCPAHVMHPPQVTTLEDLHNLANTTRILEGLGSALPRLDIPSLVAELGVDDDLLGKLYSSQEISAIQTTAALLTLCGWSRGTGAYLKCKGCCRSVGLWSFVTQADEVKPQDPTSKSSEMPTLASRKHKTSEPESSGDESVFASPEKHVDPEDTQAQWRMRLRERRVSEQSSSEESHPRRKRGSERSRKSSTSSQASAKEESASLLIIDTSPSIKKQKIQKQSFHPLEEHRPWCPWIIEDKEINSKGYRKVLNCVKDVIKQSEAKRNNFADRIDGNVQGVRLLRTLLDDLGTE